MNSSRPSSEATEAKVEPVADLLMDRLRGTGAAVGGHSCCSKAGNRCAVHCGSAGRSGRRERKGGGEL
eukprot:253391-Hanusia_phi.AAC.1